VGNAPVEVAKPREELLSFPLGMLRHELQERDLLIGDDGDTAISPSGSCDCMIAEAGLHDSATSVASVDTVSHESIIGKLSKISALRKWSADRSVLRIR
jgi:hypothetical protein